MISEEQRQVLQDIFNMHESLDKISVTLDHATRDVTITITDLDDSWFQELAGN